MLHHGDELIEEITAVMRTGRGFRVVLYGEGRAIFQPDAFDGFIIEVDMCDLRIGRIPDSYRINTEAMVLCGDLANAGHQVFDGMVKSPVSVVHLERRYTIGKGKQLMSQTDAEQRFFQRE